MPNFEARPDSGSLFVNDRKVSDKHPDRSGRAEIICPHCHSQSSFWVNGWIKTTQAGAKFMSLSFRPRSNAPQPGRNGGELDRDVDW